MWELTVSHTIIVYLGGESPYTTRRSLTSMELMMIESDQILEPIRAIALEDYTVCETQFLFEVFLW